MPVGVSFTWICILTFIKKVIYSNSQFIYKRGRKGHLVSQIIGKRGHPRSEAKYIPTWFLKYVI